MVQTILSAPGLASGRPRHRSGHHRRRAHIDGLCPGQKAMMPTGAEGLPPIQSSIVLHPLDMATSACGPGFGLMDHLRRPSGSLAFEVWLRRHREDHAKTTELAATARHPRRFPNRGPTCSGGVIMDLGRSLRITGLIRVVSSGGGRNPQPSTHKPGLEGEQGRCLCRA